MKKKILSGWKLPEPAYMKELGPRTDFYNSVMVPCWDLAFGKRPSFKGLVHLLGKMLDDDSDEQMTITKVDPDYLVVRPTTGAEKDGSRYSADLTKHVAVSEDIPYEYENVSPSTEIEMDYTQDDHEYMIVRPVIQDNLVRGEDI